jgi:RNA polymerase sigma factor (sigma-70 family)
MTLQDEALALLPAVTQTRERFLELVSELRPQLHRYCARMTGSVFDGEDVVQDSLAKAYYALGQMSEPPPFRPWLFRIAHNSALDFLKRYERRNVDVVAEVPEQHELAEPAVDPDLVEAALSVFVELPPVQRSALILKDVLGHSLDEAATTLDITVGAVKAALSRARANVAPVPKPVAQTLSAEQRSTLDRYVELFNLRNWDGLRALLGEETRVDLVTRLQRRVVDAQYFDNYERVLAREDIRAAPGFVDGVVVIAMFRSTELTKPAYFLLLEWQDAEISLIRDFRYVPYIASDARFSRG